MLARLLVVVLAATQASGLAIAAPAACPAVAVRSNLRMALPSIDDANKLSDDELTQEIFNAKKELFELRKNVKTRQQVKPHLFTHTKHRIAQLTSLLAKRAEA